MAERTALWYHGLAPHWRYADNDDDVPSKNLVVSDDLHPQLDLYCEELRVGVEYHGPHHRRKIPGHDFERQRKRDRRVRIACRIHRIELIECHIEDRDTAVSEILDTIVDLIDNGFLPAEPFRNIREMTP